MAYDIETRMVRNMIEAALDFLLDIAEADNLEIFENIQIICLYHYLGAGLRQSLAFMQGVEDYSSFKLIAGLVLAVRKDCSVTVTNDISITINPAMTGRTKSKLIR